MASKSPISPILPDSCAASPCDKLPGWKCDIRGIRIMRSLPENCRKYVEFIEAQVGAPIHMVSNGPRREDILYR